MAKEVFMIDVHCNKCQTFLYRYQKEGGGELVKCYVDKIVEDATNGDLCCPKCDGQFARNAIIHNRPAHKIIGGKVYVKGHHGK